MAHHLASLFATEKDRVNCPFYFKIGACRHGDRCSRIHTKPSISPTLLLSNMYLRPDMIASTTPNPAVDPKKMQQHFEDFFEDLFEELRKYGEIESLNVCDNLGDHMVGNVYVQFRDEEQAANALKNLSGRFYAGRPIIAEFSPVTDFREATCRQHEEDSCSRGGDCNFMHLKTISRAMRRRLFGKYFRRSRSRSRSPHRHNDRHRESRHGRRHDERDDHRHQDWSSRRRRNVSPARGRRNASPLREGSEERRAKIELWNREREQQESGNKVNNDRAKEDSHYNNSNEYSWSGKEHSDHY